MRFLSSFLVLLVLVAFAWPASAGPSDALDGFDENPFSSRENYELAQPLYEEAYEDAQYENYQDAPYESYEDAQYEEAANELMELNTANRESSQMGGSSVTRSLIPKDRRQQNLLKWKVPLLDRREPGDSFDVGPNYRCSSKFSFSYDGMEVEAVIGIYCGAPSECGGDVACTVDRRFPCPGNLVCLARATVPNSACPTWYRGQYKKFACVAPTDRCDCPARSTTDGRSFSCSSCEIRSDWRCAAGAVCMMTEYPEADAQAQMIRYRQ